MNEFGLSTAWNEILKNYQIEEKIGEGSFGKVYKATCLLTNQVVAIKHLEGFSYHDYDCVKLVREI